MEGDNQNTSEEVKAGDIAFRLEDISYPRCPLHRTDASLVPKNDEGWTKYSNHILKCLRCIKIEKLDSNKFMLLDDVLEEYSHEFNRINKQQAQDDFVGKLNDWLKKLAVLQDSIRELTESIHDYIKLHQGDQLTQKLRGYLDACITKETPDYDGFAEKLKMLKQHFSFNKTRVKIVENPAMLARKVNKYDAELHQMVEDMQSRITKFREGMSEVEPEAKDLEINVDDSIEDKPESIVAYSFETGTKTFKYITVEGVKSNNFTYKYKTINHISNFPQYHQAPMTRKGDIQLIGGFDVNHYQTCWELDLERSTMVQKQNMKNKRSRFSGAAVQDKHIQVVTGYDGSSQTKSCERQNVAANTWEDVADYPFIANGTACCSFDDRYIYSIGGFVSGAYSKDICVYDISKNSWSGVNIDSAAGREIIPSRFKNATQINEKQIQLFGGEQSPTESCLLEVDEGNINKIKVKENNRIKPSEKQDYRNSQDRVVQQGKLQCSQYSTSWIYKTSCFDSEKWQILQ